MSTPRTGSADTENHSEEPPHETRTTTNFSLRAARIQLGALLAALALAIVIALGITTGAFVLSFAVQRDLARQALIPEHLTWIFPAIVDSAILGATIAIVIISKLNMNRRDRGFYIALAVSVVVISILGNAYHAYHAAIAAREFIAGGGDLGFTPLAPAIAAAIAIIPPALVLAFTEGIVILVKAVGMAYVAYRAIVERTVMGDEAPTLVTTTATAPNAGKDDPVDDHRMHTVEARPLAPQAQPSGNDFPAELDAAEAHVPAPSHIDAIDLETAKATVLEHSKKHWQGVAATMRARQLTTRPTDEVAEMLRMRFEEEQSLRTIGEHFNVTHSTVSNIVQKAESVVNDAPADHDWTDALIPTYA